LGKHIEKSGREKGRDVKEKVRKRKGKGKM
jgi:hypothetical protein